ncbi:hypothetical protein C0989_005985 [Termitomyces sp. Mn162]|nr:hypothetical protein C0989_005985 [Termitomyces sp. Mn162]
MSRPQTFKQIVLNERPVGDFEPNTFRTEVLPFTLKPGQDEVLVRCTWLSLDPAMRGYVRDARSYLPPVKIGEGVKDVAQVKEGDIMVVSGAAGSVGAIACQLGKRAGAKVYGIAGSPDKCDWLVKELCIDGAFNYKSETFREDFKKIGYVDVFFDNVGGDILDMVLTRLAQNARIALCGAISQYNATKPRGLQNYLSLIAQRAKIQGFIVFDYAARYPEAVRELSAGLVDGSIKRKFHIIEGGIEQAPKSLPLLFNGGNTGKLVVNVSDERKANL